MSLYQHLSREKLYLLKTEMTTRAELAFKALDKDNSGYITNREMKNLSSKLSATELDALMRKVGVIKAIFLKFTFLV